MAAIMLQNFNLTRLAQLDPEGTERYLLENGLDQKEFKAN